MANPKLSFCPSYISRNSIARGDSVCCIAILISRWLLHIGYQSVRVLTSRDHSVTHLMALTQLCDFFVYVAGICKL